MDAAIQPTAIRRIASDRPWHWLALGWHDFTASLAVSLPYGAALTLAGWVIGLLMFEAEIAWAILPAAAGFFLVAPLLAAGLYETSRRRAMGLTTTVAQSLEGFRRNGAQIGLMGVALLLIHLFWVRVATLLFALFFDTSFAPSLSALPAAMLQSPMLLPFLLVGTGFGFVLASAAFAISAISIPMLVDQPVSALEAITTSIRAVVENPRPMLLWAGLIVVFTGFALVPFFLGLAVAMPLIGHATWHAYRDLVDQPSIP